MKILIGSKKDAFGLVEPTGEESIIEIGTFDQLKIDQVIEFCRKLGEYGERYDTILLRLGYLEINGQKLLAAQPGNMMGEAWVVLAQRIAEEG